MKQIALRRNSDNEGTLQKVIKDEVEYMKEKIRRQPSFRNRICFGRFNPEDFYADDEMVITISHGIHQAYTAFWFDAQNRGGVGSKGSETRNEDFIEHIYRLLCQPLLFFTQKGKVLLAQGIY